MEQHEALMTWAIEEMKFRESNGDFILPSKQDFQRLCKPPLSDVWTYVMKHVKAVQTVKRVKGNLMIQDHLALKQELEVEGDTEKSELSVLVGEKRRLLSELSSAQAELVMMEGEMEHTKADIAATELEYEGSRQQIRDLQKKENLLRVVEACVAENVDRYKEYASRVSHKTKDVVSCRSNQAEMTYSKGKGQSIESQCCRDVRLACEACGDFLKLALNGKFGDKQALEKAKEEVYKKVEALTTVYTAGMLVSALTTNTLTAASATRVQTVGINIAQDVADLSFNLRSDGLQDTSTPPTVQESVKHLLQESNVEHIMRWFKEQEHKNESWKLEARLDSLLAEIKKFVERSFGDHGESRSVAKRYVNSLITLAIERSVVPCLKEVIQNLEERREKAKQESEELRGKFECIQNFRSIVDKKQSIIEVLAKQNSAAPERLKEQRKQVLRFIEDRPMSSHQVEVESHCGSLKNSLSLEVEQFSQLLMPSLLTLPLDSTSRQCVLDMSLSPSLYPAVCRKAKFYRNLSNSLGFPAYKSVDGLLEHVMDQQHQLHGLQHKQQMRTSCIQRAKDTSGTDDDVNAIIALCEEVKQHDDRQKTHLVPQLEKCVTLVRKHNKESSRVKQQVQTWWDQPAQHLTPWLLTEGLTFDQWMRKWRSAVAQVHKKMVMTPQKKKVHH